MGLRFRKSAKLLPGVRVNLSKSGASLSVGQRGASVSFGKRGTHANVGMPGTGLSYRTRVEGTSGLWMAVGLLLAGLAAPLLFVIAAFLIG